MCRECPEAIGPHLVPARPVAHAARLVRRNPDRASFTAGLPNTLAHWSGAGATQHQPRFSARKPPRQTHPGKHTLRQTYPGAATQPTPAMRCFEGARLQPCRSAPPKGRFHAAAGCGDVFKGHGFSRAVQTRPKGASTLPQATGDVFKEHGFQPRHSDAPKGASMLPQARGPRRACSLG